MKYCDTNILTSGISKQNLTRVLGKRGYQKYGRNITGFESDATNKLKNIDECVISKGALLRDIGNHLPSVGAVLTSTVTKNIKTINVKKGYKIGKKIYNETCLKEDKNTGFYKKFCRDEKLREDLSHQSINDINHLGSAVKIGADKFITSNNKDFKPVEKYASIKIE